MIHYIRDSTNSFLSFVKDDPVRPEIPTEFRVSNGRLVIVLSDETPEDTPEAMVCVSFHNVVPENVSDLSTNTDSPTMAVFYTIWSYKPGKGAELLLKAVRGIREQYPSVTRFVTLSPKTQLARQFHLKNGAGIFRENLDTVNYEYVSVDLV
jgi:hypothetical protein